jgi:hypothetical protein
MNELVNSEFWERKIETYKHFHVVNTSSYEIFLTKFDCEKNNKCSYESLITCKLKHIMLRTLRDKC